MKLTEDGIKSVDDEISPRERAMARVRLAIERIPPFKAVYDKIVGNKLPVRAALIDLLKEEGVTDEFVNEAVDTFTLNLGYIDLLQTLSGAERVLTVEHMLEGHPARRGVGAIPGNALPTSSVHQALTTQEKATFDMSERRKRDSASVLSSMRLRSGRT